MNRPLYRCAAHRLLVGDWVFQMPLIEVDEDGKVSLESFYEEVERTIFHSGSIRLKHKEIEEEIGIVPQVVPLERMRQILDSRDGWSISFE